MRARAYREYALECLRFASGMATPEGRASLLDTAVSWFKLADQAEKNEKSALVCEPPLPRLGVVRQMPELSRAPRPASLGQSGRRPQSAAPRRRQSPNSASTRSTPVHT
jgi:hypothetical protein